MLLLRPRARAPGAVTLVAASGLAALALSAPGAANHETPGVHGSLTTSWAKLNYSAYRRGWGALLSVRLADTRRDHASVYAEAELAVADWLDPDRTILRNRSGAGTTRSVAYLFHGDRLDPQGEIGTGISAVRFKLCRVKTGVDPCVRSPWRGLPQQRSHTVPGHPDALATADALMRGTLAGFLATKAAAPAPFLWGDDGCSSPLKAVGLANHPSVLVIVPPFLRFSLPSGPRPTSFRPACTRHDFGYRNYGYSNSGLQLSPTDMTRRWVDGVFLQDMRAACGGDGNCLAWADVYWKSVRIAGGPAFFDDRAGNPPPPTGPPPLQLTGASEVSAGANHTCALHAAGASCWGLNATGQLGDGTTVLRTRPVTVPLDRPTAISAGGSHTCAVDAGGAACWGQNASGQLGDGTTTSASRPVRVAGLTEATTVRASTSFSCALRVRGVVSCWGLNRDGRLGNGGTANSPTPVSVVGIVGATDLAVGGGHACALVVRGMVRCWGRNSAGQLGNGTRTGSAVPVPVAGISGATRISAGSNHTCALLGDGTMHCWGSNVFGRLGDGTTTSRETPVRILGFTGVAEIAAGGAHTCARFLLERLPPWCWGSNQHGQLGVAGPLTSNPIAVGGFGSVLPAPTRIAAGGSHTCAVVAGGRVACWGANAQGQLGDGTRVARAAPAYVVAG